MTRSAGHAVAAAVALIAAAAPDAGAGLAQTPIRVVEVVRVGGAGAELAAFPTWRRTRVAVLDRRRHGG